jgi:hypothetical protein
MKNISIFVLILVLGFWVFMSLGHYTTPHPRLSFGTIMGSGLAKLLSELLWTLTRSIHFPDRTH